MQRTEARQVKKLKQRQVIKNGSGLARTLDPFVDEEPPVFEFNCCELSPSAVDISRSFQNQMIVSHKPQIYSTYTQIMYLYFGVWILFLAERVRPKILHRKCKFCWRPVSVRYGLVINRHLPVFANIRLMINFFVFSIIRLVFGVRFEKFQLLKSIQIRIPTQEYLNYYLF